MILLNKFTSFLPLHYVPKVYSANKGKNNLIFNINRVSVWIDEGSTYINKNNAPYMKIYQRVGGYEKVLKLDGEAIWLKVLYGHITVRVYRKISNAYILVENYIPIMLIGCVDYGTVQYFENKEYMGDYVKAFQAGKIPLC